MPAVPAVEKFPTKISRSRLIVIAGVEGWLVATSLDFEKFDRPTLPKTKQERGTRKRKNRRTDSQKRRRPAPTQYRAGCYFASVILRPVIRRAPRL